MRFKIGQYKQNFNSHAHVERDIHDAMCYNIITAFQLTRSRGAWLHDAMCYNIITAFQLTRSRGAWQAASVLIPFSTNFNSHAHVERDIYICDFGKNTYNFNSHAHVERDKNQKAKPFTRYISTHTLTWSVTERHWNWTILKGFQLTRSRGAWQREITVRFFGLIFQLTRSRGAWLAITQWQCLISQFQLTRSRGAWLSASA